MDSQLLKNLVSEMQAVKKLLVLQLLQNGASQRQIAALLDVSEATMSRMIPKGVAAANSKNTKKAPS